jgi:AcrR family transcriptional regulator
LPKAGLSHDLVVREAAQVADDVGWENLTLAVVAQRLGVSMPALYKHIGSLEGLRHDVAVLALMEMADSMTAAVKGTSGQEALFALAQAYRTYGQRHPGRYMATVRAPSWIDAEHSSAARSVLRVAYTTLEGYGLAGRDAADAVRAVRATLHGFVSLEAGGGFGTPADLDRSYRRLVEGLDATLAHWAPAVHTADVLRGVAAEALGGVAP